MDLKEIQSLIKFVARSGAAEVKLETEEFKISIKTENAIRSEGNIPQVISVPQAEAVAPAAHAPVASPVLPSESKPAADSSAGIEDSRYVAIKSPMIGTFYRRPSPDKELFVNVGDEISQGSVVCIIEAMKLFNEIESEISGKIVKELVDDQSPVEYDQPLFLVDPS